MTELENFLLMLRKEEVEREQFVRNKYRVRDFRRFFYL